MSGPTNPFAKFFLNSFQENTLMSRFVQLHVLTSHLPSNLNRDDTGRPKTALMGDAMRLRISSQSQKRAWRTSDIFEVSLAGHLGARTKLMGKEIYQALKKAGIAEKAAREWTKAIAARFGKLKSDKKRNTMKTWRLSNWRTSARRRSPPLKR
jgi:hypothetical protein